MALQTSKLSLVTFVLLLIPGYILTDSKSPTQDAGIFQLTLLGSVEGKSYFTEENINVNFTDAKEFCKKSGLHLATIRSAAQLAFIHNVSNTELFTNPCHWLGGRDSLTPSQFAWDNDNKTLDASVLGDFGFLPRVEIQTCVCYNPANKWLGATTCSSTYKVLCELIHGK